MIDFLIGFISTAAIGGVALLGGYLYIKTIRYIAHRLS